MRVRRPFLNPAWLFLSLPGYVGWRLLSALSVGPLGTALGIGLLLIACVVIPMGVRSRNAGQTPGAALFAWVTLLGMGFLSTLFVLTALREVLLVALRVLASPAAFAAGSVASAQAVLALALLFALLGFWVARRPHIVKVEVPIANLPQGLHGFSIAQISDVHVGPTIKGDFVRQIVARVNALKADMVAVTGDLVDGAVADLAAHTAPLAGLAARHGTFFVTGNHEYYSGERAWSAEVARLGMTVLKNRHVVLAHEGAALVLAGVTDYSAHHFDAAQQSDPVAALAGAPVGTVKVLLAHQPSSAAAAAKAGFDLQISGHTHGGQFWPWNLLVGFFQPFTRGLNRLGSMLIYVSRGTGYWGPPNRFGVPGEITYLTLIPASRPAASPA
jgi:uncharacterized protein